MPSFSGSFTTPSGQQAAPGIITVYDWTKCRIMINKQVIEPLIKMTCTRSADIAAGSAQVDILDTDKTFYDLISPGDELEIFLSEQSPMSYSNKVWGGYVDSREYDLSTKATLIVRGKEYSNGLILNMTAATVQAGKNSFTSEEPGVAIQALMSNYQVEFTTDNVLTGTGSTLTADFLNKTLFDALTSICQQFDYIFYVNLNKDLVVRNRSSVVNTPVTDYLTYTENMYSIAEQDNKELMCNDLIVYGNAAGVVSNSGAPLQDATSIAAYGVHSKRIVVSNFGTDDECTNFANAYLAVYKDPLQEFVTQSRLVAFSDPLQYIQVTSDKSNLSGSYQIRIITHEYGKKGILTKMTLSQHISDLTCSLGQLLSRVQAIEITTYT